MRVLMVIRPAAAGMLGQMLAVSDALRAQGHDVEVAAPSALAATIRERGHACQPVEIAGPLSPTADLRAALQMARVIREGDFDLVHAHGFKAGLIVRIATLAAGGSRVVVTAHNHVLYRDDISDFTKWRYRIVERMLSPRAASIIAVSEALRDELVDAYGLSADKVVTVQNGIDPAPFLAETDRSAERRHLGVPDQVPLIGTACRFAPQKGLEQLIDAFAAVHAVVPEARFVIGGDGPLAAALSERARESGLGVSLVWPGAVTDMPSFLGALDVYVNSSLSEGQPIGVLEAMAAARPIVATSVGGTPEVLGEDAGELVAPSDPGEFARAILRLLSDPDRRSALGRHARERVLERFTASRMCDQTLDVYRAVLARGRPAATTSVVDSGDAA